MVKLDKTFFNLDQDIFLCAINIPPRESPYFNSDIFDDLQNDIAKYSSEGHILLTGDFNARTGCALDYVDVDNCIHVPGDIPSPLRALRRRKSFDSQINEHGQSIIEICKACDLRILNGRTTGDSFGKITFHSPKGISTVDYFIVSHEIMSLFENFIVKEPTIFSDHSQLISWATISPSTSSQTNSHPQIDTYDLPRQFVWNQTSNEKFLNVLKQEEFLSRLSLFEKTTFTTDSEGIDLATVQFTNIINDICIRSLRLARTKRSQKIVKSGLMLIVYL